MPKPLSPWSIQRLARLALLPLFLLAPMLAHAQSLDAQDVQLVCNALGFLDPAAASGVVAVVYDPAISGSKADADAIVAAFGNGIAGEQANYTAKVVSSDDLAGGGYVAIIAANGAAGTKIMKIARARKILCATGDKSAVQAGKCVMAVSSGNEVEIVVNTSAAAAAGLDFVTAFRTLITEI